MRQVKADSESLNLAVIDIGSNTFHLLIVSYLADSQKFKEIYRERKFVYLAKDGIEYLSEETMDRGLAAFKDIVLKCEQYGIVLSRVKAVGTAALRSAKNAKIFIDRVHSECGVEIEVISGQREAELIYSGVLHSDIKLQADSLIIDIGGGSVEFILSRGKTIEYYTSINVGISQLRHQFEYVDPLTEYRKDMIYNHLDVQLSDLFYHLNNFKAIDLVGSSGPFEIIESTCQHKARTDRSISREDVINMINQVIYLPLKDRLRFPLMPESRADLSVESLLLIDYLFKRIDSILNVKISPYALKEGVIFEMF